MDAIFSGIIRLGIIVFLYYIGKEIAKADKKEVLAIIEKIKIGDLKNISPRYTANYLGYLIEFSGMAYLAWFSGGLFSMGFYVATAIVLQAALIFHIASATNTTPFEAFNKLNFGRTMFSGNVFVRFSFVGSATMIFTGIFVCYVFSPALLP